MSITAAQTETSVNLGYMAFNLPDQNELHIWQCGGNQPRCLARLRPSDLLSATCPSENARFTAVCFSGIHVSMIENLTLLISRVLILIFCRRKNQLLASILGTWLCTIVHKPRWLVRQLFNFVRLLQCLSLLVGETPGGSFPHRTSFNLFRLS